MKNKILRTLLTAVMTITVLPMVANDYLKIYFKDGHTERHFMHLVESISTTKYDLEGNLHDDYQMQQIVMPDTTYSYYLAEIDSMTFRKVDEEQVKKNVEKINNYVIPIFEQCSTVEEMEEHIDEITSVEGVENIIRSGTDIIVKIRDWYDFVFMYPIVPDVENLYVARKAKTINIQNSKPLMQQLKKDGTPIKVAIACQMINDTRFKGQVNDLIELTERFKAMGFQAVFVPSEEGGNLDTDFYRRRMFEYDIVVLDTHGGYNEDTGWHGFLTDEYLGISTPEITIWNWFVNKLDKLGLNESGVLEPIHTDIEDAFVGYCRTGYFSSGVFIGVSDSFIAKSKFKFGEGPHIVFNGACSSLNGKDTIERKLDSKTFSGSDAVAQIFHDKGADIYMGYNNSCSYSGYAAFYYFNAMLHGLSHKSAFDIISDDYKTEKTTWEASLIDLTKSDSASRIFIVNTNTVAKTDQEMNDDYYNQKQVELKGTTSCYNLDNIGLSCGFRIATEPDINEYTNGIDIISKDAHHIREDYKEVAFSAIFKPEPGITYYYRAVTYDGFYFNWGEERIFTIEKFKDIELSVGSFCIDEGKSTTIDITGNGDYDIFNGNDKVTKVTLDGEKLIIDAIGAGESTITVTDKKTNQAASIEVIVWAKLSIAIIGNIDLEVGASANVRIMSGNNDYNLQSSDPQVATPSLVGDFVTVEALSAGTATITVTDNKTGQTASFTVTVAEPTPIDIPAEAIDLGLPSGTLWASYNVGATAPEEYGSYYAWGETEVRDQYYFTTYSLCDGTVSSCHDIGEDISGTQYDVAHMKWGDEWCMPSKEDFRELVYNCNYKETTQKGVKGFLFTGRNGNYIFLPYTGYCWNTENSKAGSEGCYWSSTQTTSVNKAHEMSFKNGEMLWDCYINRFAGLTIRPVKHVPPVPAEAIDLGLPSGTLWASYNLGAHKPEDYGQYFAWGEIKPKDWYSWGTYEHCDGTKETCHNIGAEISGTKYDAARAIWGVPWQMPTAEQIDELVKSCQHEITTLNEINVMKVTGPNGKYIYLPLAGFMSGDTLYHPGEYGLYKSGSRCDDDLRESWLLNSDADGFVRVGIWNSTGHTIRPVIKP